MTQKLRDWLESTDRPVGTVVHTLDGKTAYRAERTEDGWVFTKEPWNYGRSE